MSKEDIEIYQSINANKGGRIINKGSTDDVSVSKVETKTAGKAKTASKAEAKTVSKVETETSKKAGTETISKAEPETATKIEPETAGKPKNQKSHNDSELSFMTGNDRYDHGCF